MKKGSQIIKTIRILAQVQGHKEVYEIFKLSLSPNKEDFIFIGKGKAIKVSFHKDGKKYLRISHNNSTRRATLYKDKHYNAANINPIFSYFPKKLNCYPTRELKIEKRTMTMLIEPYGEDFVFNVFWVNTDKNGRFEVPKYSYNSKSTVTEESIDDPSKTTSFDNPKCINLGFQQLYFDMVEIKKNTAGSNYEAMRIYNPGIKTPIQVYAARMIPMNISEIEEMGCSMAGRPEDDFYTLVY